MIAIAIVAALAVLALITQAGVVVLQRAYPVQGQKIESPPLMSSTPGRAMPSGHRS
jgi:hypothetical protein